MKLHLILLVFACCEGYPHSDKSSDGYLEQEPSQSFYPSFPPFQNPPLGHSRPFFYQQEGAYSQRPLSGFQQVTFDAPRFAGYKDVGLQRVAANSEARGVLGSGNFGVIKGGTFYDNKEAASANYDRGYSSLFRNGHGRPAYYGGGNPKPTQHQQFENFRDFADINTPSSAYSQFVVVYVNKNGTKAQPSEEAKTKPKNIIESLALLDLENPPEKKKSKSKAKLAKLLPAKKYKVKKSRDLHEPLLALS